MTRIDYLRKRNQELLDNVNDWLNGRTDIEPTVGQFTLYKKIVDKIADAIHSVYKTEH